MSDADRAVILAMFSALDALVALQLRQLSVLEAQLAAAGAWSSMPSDAARALNDRMRELVDALDASNPTPPEGTNG